MRMLLVLLLAVPLLAQTAPKMPVQKSQSKSTAGAAKGAPQRSPMVAGPVQQVAMQEVRFRDAVMQGDDDAIAKLVADGYVGTAADGKVTGKKEVLEMAKLGDVRTPSMELSDMQVHPFGPNMAVVTGQAELKGVTGEQQLVRTYRYTRVWQKLPGVGWKLLAFQATELPTPAKTP